MTPELKQFGELELEDFQRHPVWIGCHTADYGEPWYGDTDEETFRPYRGDLPVDSSEGMLLVRAAIELKDGSRYPGFVTPGLDLGTQQPQIFVDDSFFGFWGGMAGVPEQSQQELYRALGKAPDQIFPLRFAADAGLTNGPTDGLIEGFYRRSPEGVEVSLSACQELSEKKPTGPLWFQMSARGTHGYPQPEAEFGYRGIVYAKPCARCGIFGGQIAPFRVKKGRGSSSGFTALGWVNDAFFAPPGIVQEMTNAGITGVLPGPAVFHSTGNRCEDRVQLIISTVVACAEISHLPTVTCRPDNEEVVAFRARFPKRESDSDNLSPELKEYFRKLKEKIAALPYCGSVKYHPPTSVSLVSDRLVGAPDLFQTAEWFGSGGSAFRLTIASERFANLVRQRGWKGLAFREVALDGYSERAMS